MIISALESLERLITPRQIQCHNFRRRLPVRRLWVAKAHLLEQRNHQCGTA